MEVQKSESFVDQIQNQINQFFANMQITSSDVIEWASCFGLGFAAGLVLKRYGKYIIATALALTLFLAVLSYADFILINQAKLKFMLGFPVTETFTSIVNKLLLQAKMHFLQIGIILLGCLLGFKFG